MAVDREDKRFFDFMCSCAEEGKTRCEDTYDEALATLSKRFKRNISDKEFTHYVVIGLDYMNNGQANIEHIETDMWSGIAVRYRYNYKEEFECEDENEERVSDCKCDADPKYDCQWRTQEFWIECDQIHHGLARAYQLVRSFDKTVSMA